MAELQILERVLAESKKAFQENKEAKKESWEALKRLLGPYRRALYDLLGIEDVISGPHQLRFDGGIYYTIWWVDENGENIGSIEIPSLEAMRILLQKLVKLLEEKIHELSEETNGLRELKNKIEEVTSHG